jgi:GNAT superfamily N-acetyltransferase
VSDASGITIRRLTPGDVDAASEMLSRAFSHDPGAFIVEPDDALRLPTIRALFAPVVRWAIPFGHVSGAFDGDGRLLGVATFVPPGHDTASDAELETAGLAEAVAAVPAAALRMGRMTEFLEAQHEQAISGPHWRLDFYGVEPAAQSTGIGSRLIATGHDAADAAGEPVWLETFTIENVRFYERRGYRVVVEGIVPGTAYPLWGLIRDPRPPDPGPSGSWTESANTRTSHPPASASSPEPRNTANHRTTR